MKKRLLTLLSTAILATALFSPAKADEAPAEAYRSVGYVRNNALEKFGADMDVSNISHLNYAFGHVNEDSVTVDDDALIETLISLKDKNPDLKILISLQHVGDPTRFSRRCLTPEGRTLLVDQTMEIVDKFGFDGVDLDWEYPGINLWTLERTDEADTENFTALLQEFRDRLGEERLLTIACGADIPNQEYTDFAAISPILDFMNVMGYDYNWNKFGTAHHSNLLPASVGNGNPEVYGEAGINSLLDKGVPAEKIVLGVPFYGYLNSGEDADARNYTQIKEMIESGEYTLEYDETTQQSYLAKDGEMALGFDDPVTLEFKADYVKENGLGGMMFWDYGHDDDEGTLRQAIWEGLNGAD